MHSLPRALLPSQRTGQPPSYHAQNCQIRRGMASHRRPPLPGFGRAPDAIRDQWLAGGVWANTLPGAYGWDLPACNKDLPHKTRHVSDCMKPAGVLSRCQGRYIHHPPVLSSQVLSALRTPSRVACANTGRGTMHPHPQAWRWKRPSAVACGPKGRSYQKYGVQAEPEKYEASPIVHMGRGPGGEPHGWSRHSLCLPGHATYLSISGHSPLPARKTLSRKGLFPTLST